jgi:hypothetical protein
VRPLIRCHCQGTFFFFFFFFARGPICKAKEGKRKEKKRKEFPRAITRVGVHYNVMSSLVVTSASPVLYDASKSPILLGLYASIQTYRHTNITCTHTHIHIHNIYVQNPRGHESSKISGAVTCEDDLPWAGAELSGNRLAVCVKCILRICVLLVPLPANYFLQATVSIRQMACSRNAMTNSSSRVGQENGDD